MEAYTLEGKFFINPGTATGAFSTDWPELDDAEQGEPEASEVNKEESQEGSKEVNNEKNEVKVEKKDEDNYEDSDDEDLTYDTIPSFTLLDIQGCVVTLYIYTYINGEVKVDKVSYRKGQQQ